MPPEILHPIWWPEQILVGCIVLMFLLLTPWSLTTIQVRRTVTPAL